MTNLNTNNVIIIVIAIVIIIALIYYFNRNNKPISNEGTINNAYKSAPKSKSPSLAPRTVSDSIVDDMVSDYNKNNKKCEISGLDPFSSDHGAFDNYGQKKQVKSKDNSNERSCDPRDFKYKKQKFTKRTPDDVKDLFDVNKMLPQEIEEDWFDTEPLMSTKKINGSNLIHPKVHMGINTVGSSLRNGTHDIRGDIPNPKIPVSPWGNSTMDPDTNIKGFC